MKPIVLLNHRSVMKWTLGAVLLSATLSLGTERVTRPIEYQAEKGLVERIAALEDKLTRTETRLSKMNDDVALKTELTDVLRYGSHVRFQVQDADRIVGIWNGDKNAKIVEAGPKGGNDNWFILIRR